MGKYFLHLDLIYFYLWSFWTFYELNYFIPTFILQMFYYYSIAHWRAPVPAAQKFAMRTWLKQVQLTRPGPVAHHITSQHSSLDSRNLFHQFSLHEIRIWSLSVLLCSINLSLLKSHCKYLYSQWFHCLLLMCVITLDACFAFRTENDHVYWLF